MCICTNISISILPPKALQQTEACSHHGAIGPLARTGWAELTVQESCQVIRQALANEFTVCRRLRRCSTFAAGQQWLFAHNGSSDNRAPHPIPIIEVDRTGWADLRTGTAADA